MGADGFIVDPGRPVTFAARCYQCSRLVAEYDPKMGHEGCIGKDGKLAVNLDAEDDPDDENYEQR